jgi:hypothetical protein
VTLAADGTFTYTPTSGFSGADSFTYHANDGTTTTLATVNITVQPSGGEGESSAIDAALLSLLGGSDESAGGSDESAGASDESWEDGVDAAMSQLG